MISLYCELTNKSERTYRIALCFDFVILVVTGYGYFVR